MWENIQRGNYETNKGSIYFRSKWEANYALYLDWLVEQKQIKDWEYEPKPRYEFISYEFSDKEKKFPKVMSLGYLPDFKVINNDDTFYLVEVKGVKQGMMKLKRMKKYYPHIKVELVEHDDIKLIYKQLGKLIAWN